MKFPVARFACVVLWQCLVSVALANDPIAASLEEMRQRAEEARRQGNLQGAQEIERHMERIRANTVAPGPLGTPAAAGADKAVQQGLPTPSRTPSPGGPSPAPELSVSSADRARADQFGQQARDLLRANEPAAAAIRAREALRLFAGQQSALIVLGDLAAAQGDEALANEMYRRAQMANPDSADAAIAQARQQSLGRAGRGSGAATAAMEAVLEPRLNIYWADANGQRWRFGIDGCYMETTSRENIDHAAVRGEGNQVFNLRKLGGDFDCPKQIRDMYNDEVARRAAPAQAGSPRTQPAAQPDVIAVLQGTWCWTQGLARGRNTYTGNTVVVRATAFGSSGSNSGTVAAMGDRAFRITLTNSVQTAKLLDDNRYQWDSGTVAERCQN